jgi:membrane-associated phospholipid phosphatase
MLWFEPPNPMKSRKRAVYRRGHLVDCDPSAGPCGSQAWRCHGRLGSLHVLIYVVVFNITSAIAAFRGSQVKLHMPLELAIPFSPIWIWPYVSLLLVIAIPPVFLDEPRLRRLGMQSLVVLAVASVCVVFYPAELGFSRSLPGETPYRQIFAWLFAIDRPNNIAPSLHVALATLCLLAFAEATTSQVVRLALWSWLAMIAASTVLVHQHHLLDIAGGFALACVVRHCLALSPSTPLGRKADCSAIGLTEDKVAQHQQVDVRSQKNADGVLHVMDHGPPHHIEAGVQQDRHAGLAPKY